MQVRLLLRVFFVFFYKQVLLWVVGGGGFHDNWDLGSQEILSSLMTFTDEAERTLLTTFARMAIELHTAWGRYVASHTCAAE